MAVTNTVQIRNDNYSFKSESRNSASTLTNISVAAMSSMLIFSPGELTACRHEPSILQLAGEIKQAQPVANLVSDSLKNIRKQFNFNVTELADLLGVSRPTIYGWLKGESGNKPSVVERLQTLSAAADYWTDITEGKASSYLFSYRGLDASDTTILEGIKAKLGLEELKARMKSRLGEYQEVSHQAREILGPITETSTPTMHAGARRLNAAWAENAKALHVTKKR